MINARIEHRARLAASRIEKAHASLATLLVALDKAHATREGDEIARAMDSIRHLATGTLARLFTDP